MSYERYEQMIGEAISRDNPSWDDVMETLTREGNLDEFEASAPIKSRQSEFNPDNPEIDEFARYD